MYIEISNPATVIGADIMKDRFLEIAPAEV